MPIAVLATPLITTAIGINLGEILMNSADIEFYESAAVMAVAYQLSGTKREEFSALSYHTRQRHLNQAIKIVQLVLEKSMAVQYAVKKMEEERMLVIRERFS
jgi:hypothetical protein